MSTAPVAAALTLALLAVLGIDLLPLLAPDGARRPPLHRARRAVRKMRAWCGSVRAGQAALNAVTVRALRARDPQILRDYRDSQAVPRRPAQTRLLAEMEPEAGSVPPHPAGPAGTVPADGPPVHAGAVPLTPRGRHHAGQPRQPWDTMSGEIPVCREPLAGAPEPEPEGDPVPYWRPYVTAHEQRQYRRWLA